MDCGPKPEQQLGPVQIAIPYIHGLGFGSTFSLGGNLGQVGFVHFAILLGALRLL